MGGFLRPPAVSRDNEWASKLRFPTPHLQIFSIFQCVVFSPNPIRLYVAPSGATNSLKQLFTYADVLLRNSKQILNCKNCCLLIANQNCCWLIWWHPYVRFLQLQPWSEHKKKNLRIWDKTQKQRRNFMPKWMPKLNKHCCSCITWLHI